MPAAEKWGRRDSGPVVRPYAVTGGRTEPADGEVFDLLAVVVVTAPNVKAADPAALTPEHRRILDLCRQQITIADIAADTALPVGVVRVLLADLIALGAITPVRERPAGQRTSSEVLQEILNGLRAL